MLCCFTYNGVLALMSSAKLCVRRVLHIENPAANQHSEPREEQVLYPYKGDPSLGGMTTTEKSLIRATTKNKLWVLWFSFYQIVLTF